MVDLVDIKQKYVHFAAPPSNRKSMSHPISELEV